MDILGLNKKPLEWLNKVILGHTLSQCSGKTWGTKYQFFSQNKTLIKEEINIDTNKPISYLPCIKLSSSKKRFEGYFLKSEMIWRTETFPDDWPHIVELLFPINTIGLPAPKSHSPDIIFHSHNVFLCFVNKLNKESNPIQWSQVEDEIEKAKLLLPLNKLVVLVILALHFGEEINQSIKSSGLSYLSLDSGNWYIFNFDMYITF